MTNEQIIRKGNNPEPAPGKVMTEPKREPLSDREPLKNGKKVLLD